MSKGNLSVSNLLYSIRQDHDETVRRLFRLVAKVNEKLEAVSADTNHVFTATMVSNASYASFDIFGMTIWSTDDGYPDEVKSDDDFENYIIGLVVAVVRDITEVGEILRKDQLPRGN